MNDGVDTFSTPTTPHPPLSHTSVGRTLLSRSRIRSKKEGGNFSFRFVLLVCFSSSFPLRFRDIAILHITGWPRGWPCAVGLGIPTRSKMRDLSGIQTWRPRGWGEAFAVDALFYAPFFFFPPLLSLFSEWFAWRGSYNVPGQPGGARVLTVLGRLARSVHRAHFGPPR